MKTARRYDTKLPCPACGHMQSLADKAKLYAYSFYQIGWGYDGGDDEWVTDYMPHCNDCGCRLETGEKRVKGTFDYETRWYWIALLTD